MSLRSLLSLGAVPGYYRHVISGRVYPLGLRAGISAAVLACIVMLFLEPAPLGAEHAALGCFVLYVAYIAVWFWWGGEAWEKEQESLPGQETPVERRVRQVIVGWLMGLVLIAVSKLLPAIPLWLTAITSVVVGLWLNSAWLRRRAARLKRDVPR